MKRSMLFIVGALFVATPGKADNVATLTLSDHGFAPPEIHVKADTPTTVTFVNNGVDRAVFDSVALKAKRVVAGHATVMMRWRALAPGVYPFTEEFHSETARGVVIAD